MCPWRRIRRCGTGAGHPPPTSMASVPRSRPGRTRVFVPRARAGNVRCACNAHEPGTTHTGVPQGRGVNGNPSATSWVRPSDPKVSSSRMQSIGASRRLLRPDLCPGGIILSERSTYGLASCGKNCCALEEGLAAADPMGPIPAKPGNPRNHGDIGSPQPTRTAGAELIARYPLCAVLYP